MVHQNPLKTSVPNQPLATFPDATMGTVRAIFESANANIVKTLKAPERKEREQMIVKLTACGRVIDIGHLWPSFN